MNVFLTNKDLVPLCRIPRYNEVDLSMIKSSSANMELIKSATNIFYSGNGRVKLLKTRMTPFIDCVIPEELRDQFVELVTNY